MDTSYARVAEERTNHEAVVIQPYTVKLKFPCEIRQTDRDTIEITVSSESQAPFHPDFITEMQEKFGKVPTAQWLEAELQRINRELLLKQVR